MPVSPGSHGSRYSRGVDALGGQRARAGRSSRSTSSIAMLSQRDEAAEPVGDLSRTARGSSVVRIDSVIWRSSRWLAELALERLRSGRAAARSCRRWPSPGRRSSRRSTRSRRSSSRELVEPELREDEDAEDLVVEEHRREEHRFVEVVLGARDRVRPRVGGGVAAGSGRSRCSATQPVMPSPSATASWSGVSSTYSPTWPCIATGMRSLAARAGRPGRCGSRSAGAARWRSTAPISRDAGQPAQPGAELLDRLELGGPGRHLLVVLGGLDRDAGLGRRGRPIVSSSSVGPVVRLVVVDVEQAEQRPAPSSSGAVHSVSKPSWTTAARTRRAARVVAVVDREHRPPGGDRERRAAIGSGSRGRRRGTSATGRG